MYFFIFRSYSNDKAMSLPTHRNMHRHVHMYMAIYLYNMECAGTQKGTL